MNISKKIHPQGKSLLRLLKSTPETFALHLSEGQRHPSATYALSLTRTLRRLDEVLDRLKAYTLSVQLDAHDGADQQLAEASEELIAQIAKHIDDGRTVVANYFGIESEVLARFVTSTRSLSEARLLQAERIARHGERVRLISFMAPSAIVSGFFVEGVDAAGTLGPSPSVHAGNGAFSYNLYLRKLLVDLVSLNARLYETVAGAGIRENNAISASENPDLIRIAARIAELGIQAFPDEVRGHLPAIAVKREAQGDAATVAATSLKKGVLPPSPCTISVSAEAERLVGGYRVPYAMVDNNKSPL